MAQPREGMEKICRSDHLKWTTISRCHPGRAVWSMKWGAGISWKILKCCVHRTGVLFLQAVPFRSCYIQGGHEPVQIQLRNSGA